MVGIGVFFFFLNKNFGAEVVGWCPHKACEGSDFSLVRAVILAPIKVLWGLNILNI